MQDDLGGIKGKEIESLSGFAIDKKKCFELQFSIDNLMKKKLLKKHF